MGHGCTQIGSCAMRFKDRVCLVTGGGSGIGRATCMRMSAEGGHAVVVDLRGVFLFCKYAIPHMPAGSAIVNTSSVHAHQTTPNVSPYVASKGGMEAFCRCLALELGDKKIRINCVAPGAVDTPMLWN